MLYLTNTTNPCHLYEVAKETADAMVNADLTFIAFKNCELDQFDKKDESIAEIKKFIEKDSNKMDAKK